MDLKKESYSKFAEKCGYATSTIQNMFLRDSEPRADLLQKIVDVYGVSADWLLQGKGNLNSEIKVIQEQPQGMAIPYLDQTVSAGHGAELLDSEGSDCYIHIPDTAGATDLRALRVSGDSMEPTLKNGSIVICSKGGFDGDGIYVIRNAEFTFVKRIIKHPEGFTVVSDNTLYPSYICHQEDMVIVGRVVFAVLRM